MNKRIFTKLHQHDHVHGSLPTHQHRQHPNNSVDLTWKPRLQHPVLPCLNCVQEQSIIQCTCTFAQTSKTNDNWQAFSYIINPLIPH